MEDVVRRNHCAWSGLKFSIGDHQLSFEQPADTTGLIAARGPVIVSKAALVFDASVNDAAKATAKHGQLAAAGLVARETA